MNPKVENEMMRIINADIFEAKTEAIVNTVNLNGVMGKGLALIFKQKYPRMFKEYVKACKSGALYIGNIFLYEPKENESQYKFKYIINLPTKDNWRDDSKLEYIETGMKVLVEKINQLGIKSCAIPALGCQNGGLKFADVLPIMLKAIYPFIIGKSCDVYIYQPLKRSY